MDRQERNRDILAPLGASGANGRFFARCAETVAEYARKVRVILRQIKTEKQEALTEIKLLIDDWQFHRGPADTPEKQRNMHRDVLARLITRAEAKKRLRDRAEYNASLGEIGEGWELGDDVTLSSEFDGGERMTTQAMVDHYKTQQKREPHP